VDESADNIAPARERRIILLLCLFAAIHVFVFCAAFPFFNNVDEQIQLDLTIKYSQGHVPRSLERVSPETIPYVIIYGTLEYVWPSTNFPNAKFPPPAWTQPMNKIAPMLLAKEAVWAKIINYECSQPPLYYTLAGWWWRLGQACGFHDGFLLYWLRFLNVFFVAALVWLGFCTARMIFSENLFLRLGVPALIAFLPQTAFYSINNDMLSPLCFGAAFPLLVKFSRADPPDWKLGVAAGLALAATFLTKISNLPLLGVAGIFLALKIWRLFKENKLRAAAPAIFALGVCALPPMVAWLAWCKVNFGDFTGSAAKIQFLGWTVKPFAEWWHHPIFTPHGFWIFIHDLLSTFWQGEILWHRQPLPLPAVDMVYVVLTLIFIGVALLNLLSNHTPEARPQREALWFGLAGFIALIAFSGFLSIIYDFHDCFYPSRAHPYFTSGRLILGALIPFLLVFLFGLDCALKKIGNAVKFSVLAGFIVFMLVSEIATDWVIFPNAYNWFHM